MNGWILFQTVGFEKKFNKLIPKNLRLSVQKQILKLADDPFTGKPLGFKFFREKKFDKWRIYYLIYGDLVVVYFVSISDKKMQQKEIDGLKLMFNQFKEEVKNKFT